MPMKNNENNELVKDSRFSKLHSDARFNKMSKNKNKIEIDDRFSNALKQSDSSKVKIDKYGRKVNKNEKVNEMKRFYKLKDPVEEKEPELLNENDLSEEESEDSNSAPSHS